MPIRPNSIHSKRVRAMKLLRNLAVLAFTVACAIASEVANAAEHGAFQPLVIQKQGSFAVGGAVVTTPGKFDPIRQGAFSSKAHDPTGQTLHRDHAYVFYQVPQNPRKLPLAMWHGHG